MALTPGKRLGEDAALVGVRWGVGVPESNGLGMGVGVVPRLGGCVWVVESRLGRGVWLVSRRRPWKRSRTCRHLKSWVRTLPVESRWELRLLLGCVWLVGRRGKLRLRRAPDATHTTRRPHRAIPRAPVPMNTPRGTHLGVPWAPESAVGHQRALAAAAATGRGRQWVVEVEHAHVFGCHGGGGAEGTRRTRSRCSVRQDLPRSA